MRIFLFVAIFLVISVVSFAQPLMKGDEAPPFSAISLDGDSLDLKYFVGQRVLLVFFRYAGCVVCNFRAHELIEQYDTLRSRGIQVIGVFESREDLLRTYVADSEIPFPIISDHQSVLYKKYRVEKSYQKVLKGLRKKTTKRQEKEGERLYNGRKYKRDGALSRIPADFLIGSDGKIEIAYYGAYLGDHLPLSRLFE